MAQDTPESDFPIECFQNYSAPEVFVQGLAGMVDQSDIQTVIKSQKTMLQRFEKTNEMLKNCNALSENRLKIATEEFKKNTQILLDMKNDLDYIHRKVKSIREKVIKQYPSAYKEISAEAVRNMAKEIEENRVSSEE